MAILMRYVRHLMQHGLVHEFHAWNFTRDASDEQWLYHEVHGRDENCREQQAPDTFRELDGVDARFPVLIRFRGRQLRVLLSDDNGELAEIVAGDDTSSITDPHGHKVTAAPVKRDQEWNTVYVTSTDGVAVAINGQRVLSSPLVDRSQTVTVRARRRYENVPVMRSRATAGTVKVSVSGDCTFRCPRADAAERVMPVANKKAWTEYYRHYTHERYPHAIVIKCDDDIVFIDTDSFGKFVQQVDAMKDAGYLLAFPSIINNGVCAHHQQNAGVLPRDVFGELPNDTTCGRLWGDGNLCQTVHEYFAGNLSRLREVAASLSDSPVPLPLASRISINFFAVRSEDLPCTYAVCGTDDEYDLTVNLSSRTGRQHVILQSTFVAHLGFYRQRETGLDDAACVRLYDDLATRMVGPAHVT